MFGRIAVIGAGAVGLAVACELARGGHDVTVIADAPGPADCSPAAGAIWFPYGVSLDNRLANASELGRTRFHELAGNPDSGVVLRRGTYIVRRADLDTSWADALEGKRDLAPDELPEGALSGFRVKVPVIDMSRYLPWLRQEARSAGVRFVQRRIRTLAELDGLGVTIVAAGLRSPELIDDDEPGIPRRGQVVRLQNSGLTDWYIDEDAPDGMTYVIPRIDDIVCGGADTAGDADTEPDLTVEAGILQRARSLFPELAELPVLSRAVGLRPGRSVPRIGWADRDRSVMACYGHGGAGVTLSWGSAAIIAELLSTA